MSQSRGSSRETQALIRSMLQRLKLQAGTEIQGGSLPASPTATRHDWGQNRDRAPHRQTLGPNSTPAQNGFGTALVDSPGTSTDRDVKGEGLPDSHGPEVKRWDSREEFRIPAGDSNLDHPATGAKVNGEQGVVDGPILDRRKEVSPRLNSPKASYKDNTAGDSVDSGGTGQTVTSSAASGRLFPVNSQKDAEGTSFVRTNDKMEGGKEGNGNSVIEKRVIYDIMHGAVTDDHSSLGGDSTSASQYPSNSHGSDPEMTAESGALSQAVSVNGDSSPSLVQGFSPRVYAWALKGPSTGSGEIPTAHQGNEDSGPLAQSQDVEIGSKMPNSTSAPLQRNRASGSRTKRWTQKIKETFKERGGSLKKRKEGAEKEKGKVEEEGKISTQNELLTAEDVSNVLSKTLETTSEPTDTASTLLEDSAVEMRSSNDFDIGLGSFSLLEEIQTGQYWANFLSPALSDVSTTQRPAEQHADQSHIPVLAGFQEDNQSSGSVDQRGNPGVAVMATSSADLPVPETMDTSEPDGSLVVTVTHRDPRAEPMEQHSQLDVPSEEQGPTAGERDQNAGVVDNTILKNQIQRNRKRVYHGSLERTGDVGKAEEGGERDGKVTLQDGPLSSSSLANNPATVEKELAEDNGLLYLYPFKSHQSLSSPAPCEFVPKGVLKHTQPTDAEGSISMETATKKRKMEAVRRVHFSEEVVAIAPVVLDISVGTDSEEESQPEETSVTEEGNGTAQVSPGEGTDEAPPRPPTLPGWIRALKRKSERKPKR